MRATRAGSRAISFPSTMYIVLHHGAIIHFLPRLPKACWPRPPPFAKANAHSRHITTFGGNTFPQFQHLMGKATIALLGSWGLCKPKWWHCNRPWNDCNALPRCRHLLVHSPRREGKGTQGGPVDPVCHLRQLPMASNREDRWVSDWTLHGTGKMVSRQPTAPCRSRVIIWVGNLPDCFQSRAPLLGCIPPQKGSGMSHPGLLPNPHSHPNAPPPSLQPPAIPIAMGMGKH